MKIYVEHKTYRKVNGRWELTKDYGTKEIKFEQYELLKNEKWKGDRRTFEYYYEFGGRMMVRLSNTEPTYRELKSVRVFTFKK